MTTRRATWLACGAAAVLCVLVAAPTAAAAPQNPGIVVENGVTQPAFGYADAIRERVWVESDFDTDMDGVADRIAIDIMRPAATVDGLDGAGDHGREPVLLDARPRERVRAQAQDLDGTACSTAGRSSTTTTSSRAATRSCCSTWSAPNNSSGCPSPVAHRTT